MYPLTYKMETKEHIAMTEKLLGSIEAGGTKFVCGVGTDDLILSNHNQVEKFLVTN